MTMLLEVQNLRIELPSKNGTGYPVNGLSFSLAPGEIMGLVGESGSGKSMTGYALIGLLAASARQVEGRILFNGHALDTSSRRVMRAIRGNRIAMVFQDPMMTLNPVLRIGTQMLETIRAHRAVRRKDARNECLAALRRVGLDRVERRFDAYPHELSGGQRQRVAIAIALLNQPDLIIFDEPTTALDVTTQGQILREVKALCQTSGTALIWITHDLSLLSGFADTLSVMYAGRVVEQGDARKVLSRPLHPYTHGLLASLPSHTRPGQPLACIPGITPSLFAMPSGCAFRTRCPHAESRCEQSPETKMIDNRRVLCIHPLHASIDASAEAS
ncbi:ABC transporter ATP-binding protein [Paraburkholderia tropica]|uniref:ABC transporter ATP-binding protein n=1 Tax=Paraburkholderia tropica TaxID=92647 RepID=UPI002AB79F9E|nr:ABC transporter ATP-binding protein [Paraburkholderia tropica]